MTSVEIEFLNIHHAFGVYLGKNEESNFLTHARLTMLAIFWAPFVREISMWMCHGDWLTITWRSRELLSEPGCDFSVDDWFVPRMSASVRGTNMSEWSLLGGNEPIRFKSRFTLSRISLSHSVRGTNMSDCFSPGSPCSFFPPIGFSNQCPFNPKIPKDSPLSKPQR